jgi:hypothetical protein
MSLIYHLGKAEISEYGVKDLVNDLNKCIDTLEGLNKILEKTQNGKFPEAETHKRIEDGILDSIHRANNHQLNVMLKGGYKFRFYTELNNQEALRSEIQKRLRNSKLKDLGI